MASAVLTSAAAAALLTDIERCCTVVVCTALSIIVTDMGCLHFDRRECVRGHCTKGLGCDAARVVLPVLSLLCCIEAMVTTLISGFLTLAVAYTDVNTCSKKHKGLDRVHAPD